MSSQNSRAMGASLGPRDALVWNTRQHRESRCCLVFHTTPASRKYPQRVHTTSARFPGFSHRSDAPSEIYSLTKTKQSCTARESEKWRTVGEHLQLAVCSLQFASIWCAVHPSVTNHAQIVLKLGPAHPDRGPRSEPLHRVIRASRLVYCTSKEAPTSTTRSARPQSTPCGCTPTPAHSRCSLSSCPAAAAAATFTHRSLRHDLEGQRKGHAPPAGTESEVRSTLRASPSSNARRA